MANGALPSSPASGAGNNRMLDTAPPMPRGAGSPLFTEAPDQGLGANGMGGDPMIQTMQAQQAVDQSIQRLATLYPEAVDPLAQLQQQFRQLILGLTQAAAAPAQMGAPPMMPPLPMQSGPTAGTQGGPGF